MTTDNRDELLALAARVEALKGYDNSVDVLAEIALFDADEKFVAIRANDAGTKVVYTTPSGRDTTYRARDWTMSAAARANTVQALRALAHQQKDQTTP